MSDILLIPARLGKKKKKNNGREYIPCFDSMFSIQTRLQSSSVYICAQCNGVITLAVEYLHGQDFLVHVIRSSQRAA